MIQSDLRQSRKKKSNSINAKMNPSEMILRTKSAELFKIYLKMFH